jgi:aminopeptidase 2
MLCDYVGEEKFLKGVSIYLKKRLYGNSVTADLWEGISAATGTNPSPSSGEAHFRTRR